MELLKFLPPLLLQALSKLDYNRLYEIRIRADKPVRVFYGGEFFYLSSRGELQSVLQGTKKNITQGLSQGTTQVTHVVSPVREAAFSPCRLTSSQIAEIVLRAAEFSIYAFNGQLSGGYITVGGGIRIGVAGEVVYENESIKTQKNFGALVIRIPHEIKGSADIAYKSLKGLRNKNLLLISPPGCGKTTILRDLTRLVSNSGANVLLVDERNEIAASQNGVPALDVGINTDVVSNARKEYAFSFGIRSLRPDYIVTDELAGKADVEAVKKAALSGVNVIASIHASDLTDIRARAELAPLVADKIFGCYAFLSLRRGAGTYEKILDEELNLI